MKNLKKLLLASMICALSVAACLLADDYVQPQSLSAVSVYRDASSIAYTTNTYYTQGASLLMTNMIAYSTADLGTNSVVQGLSNVTVEVATSLSSSSTGTWVTATVLDAEAGTWTVTIPSLPAASAVYWQLRLTDSATNIYYYEKQILRANPHL